MKRWLVTMVACAPTTPSTVASHIDHSIEVADLDRSADPCTDFYQFSTGGWRAAHPIPASVPKWSRRMAAREANRRRLQDILDELSRRTDWPVESTEQLLGDYYASCVDATTADAAGLAPWSAAIDGARTMADVQRAIRRLHDIGVAVPFGVAGALDYHEPAGFIANVVGTGLDREGYASAVDSYRARVASVLKLAGAPDAAHDADAIVAFETRLANASLAPAAAADPVATDHMTTFAQLQQLAPHFEWIAYFDEAHLPRGYLNVAEPAYLQQVDKELVETPVAVWKAYLKWHLLDAFSPWLAEPAVDDDQPRRARCVDSTEALFGELLGRKYAEKYFSDAAKTKARTIMNALMAALHDDVAAATWMQPGTKTMALHKSAAIELELGYPDAWKPNPTVAIRRDALLANMVAARRFKVDNDRKMIGWPTPRHFWQLPPSSPDAYIEPALNQLVLPAGYLQRPIFDANATDAYNYGAIGVGVAHDLTHAIDLSGSELDRMGRPVNWWTDADRVAFARLGQCVIDQFDGYEITSGVPLQGKRVMSEAIGDLAGIRLAYAALEKSMTMHPVPTVDGFTPEQQFFIAWAQLRGEDVRLEAQRKMVATDPHPVPKFRVNGALSNSREFQRAFSCNPGSPMVRANPCVVW